MTSNRRLNVIRPAIFADVPDIVAAFSTRSGGRSAAPYASLNMGMSTGDDRVIVEANREAAFASLGFSIDRAAIAGQVHGTEVLTVEAAGLYPGYDGLVSVTPGVLLCISAADCAAILLADAGAGVVGACHAGWRGAVGGVIENTLTRMDEMGAERERVLSYVSPCIGRSAFEVGQEVAERFPAEHVVRVEGSDRPFVDLKAHIAFRLREAGIENRHLEISPHCTFTEVDRFYSHRKERGQTGRMMGMIGILS